VVKLFKDKVQKFTQTVNQLRKRFKLTMAVAKARAKEIKPKVKLGIKKPSMPNIKLPKAKSLKVYQLKMKK